MGGRPDVLVIGGGAIGCAVAWSLAREGLAVQLLERDAPGAGASGAAAGMLTPLVEAERGSALRAWGLRSLERFPSLVEELRDRSGIDAELELGGLLRVAADEAAEQALRARAAEDADLGLRFLDAAALREARPGLAPRLRGALFSPREGHLRSPLLVRAYAGAAASQGAAIASGEPVLALERAGDRVVGVRTARGPLHADAVVLCAGAASPQTLDARPGDRALPVTPVRGQIVCTDAPPPAGGPIVWGPGAYLVPKRDGSLVVGATEERVGFDRRVTAAGVRRLLQAGEALLPALGDAAFRSAWAGLRPDTPDHRPLVGPWPGAPGLVVATGHYRAGVQLSPATAELVRDGLLGKGWAEPAFLPERFL